MTRSDESQKRPQRVRCFNCPKYFVNRQGMEAHILKAKKKCYEGLFPDGFVSYCESNRRVHCIFCTKIFSTANPCEHIILLREGNTLQASREMAIGDENGEQRLRTQPFLLAGGSQTGNIGESLDFAAFSTTLATLGDMAIGNDIEEQRPFYLGGGSQTGNTGESIENAAFSTELRPGEIFVDTGSSATETFITFDAIKALEKCVCHPVECVSVIPQAAKRAAADAFSQLLREVIKNPSSEMAHARLLLFAPVVCAQKSEKKMKIATLIKQRASFICRAPLEDIVDIVISKNISKRDICDSSSSSLKPVKRLIALGRYGDAVRRLTSDGVHSSSPAIIQALVAKHPQNVTNSRHIRTPQWANFTKEEVSEAINSFPNGSSGGPLALTERYLKDMISCTQVGDSVLDALAQFGGLFVAGKFPSSLARFYGGARLIPLKKKDGGVRPMAVGETLRRLACKLALTMVKSEVSDLLLPYQLGVGTPQGTEAIVHALSKTLETLEEDEAILQIDFANAFNLVSRDIMMELVKQHLPKLYNVVGFLYTNQGLLKIGNGQETINSCSGVQQGCPLAPLLFSLVLQEIIKKVAVRVPTLKINLWYLDDGHLAGNAFDLLACLDLINEIGPTYGLTLNLSKCIVLGNRTSIFPQEVTRATDGLVVLGSPIGTNNFISKVINEKIRAAALVLFKSQALQDPQQEMLLLRCCTGAPKMVYWLRTCRPDAIEAEILKLDLIIDDALQHILGAPIFGDKRNIIHLPLSLGGLGIAKATWSKEAAFVSSVGSSWLLQRVSSPRNGYNEAVLYLKSKGTHVPQLPSDNLTDIAPLYNQAKEFSQSKFMKDKNAKLLESIRLEANDKLKVILEGRACKGASFWLTSVPNRWLNTEIDPAAFRSLLKYSIGMPLMNEDNTCPDCSKPQDKFGHHALSCKFSSGKIDRHDSIVEGISAQLRSASITHRTEKCNPMNDTRQRPGDIYMPEFDVYGDAYFDVSVISICANAYWKRAAKGQLEGSKIRYVEKMKKYPELGTRLKPLILESTGGWNAYSFDYLKKLAEHISARTNKKAKDALNSLLTAASLRLQRHQGTLLVRRCLGL